MVREFGIYIPGSDVNVKITIYDLNRSVLVFEKVVTSWRKIKSTSLIYC